jgi:hypothetical protein
MSLQTLGIVRVNWLELGFSWADLLFQAKFQYNEEAVIFLPTKKQGLRCIYLCQALTKSCCPIYVVRVDERNGQLFILAGDDIQILISRNGNWRFLT